MNAEQIRTSLLGDAKLPSESITLSNGQTVTVQGLTIGQRDQLEGTVASLQSGKRANFRALLVAWSVVDDQGHRVFHTDDLTDLAKQSAQLLEPIISKAMELSGITRRDIEEIAPEDSVGNGQVQAVPEPEFFGQADGGSGSSA